MKSPFPGMDPYIEACGLWKDFHNHLIEKIFDAVSDTLPKGYVARTGTRSYIALVEDEEKTEHHFEPDVSISSPRSLSSEGSATALADPEELTLRAFIEEEFDEHFLDIFEVDPERRLVTSVEVLSPSNKIVDSRGWKLYLRKRQALLRGRANLVEIDLLRGGTRMAMRDALPKSPYYLLAARRESAPACKVRPAYFDRPLPELRVPLARPDPDLLVPLQPLVEAISARSRYHEDIDYSLPLDPPLTKAQTAWLKRQLREEKSSTPKPRARKS